MKGIINPIHLTDEAITALHDSFAGAHPCPHIVIDNFLRPEVADQLFDNFPSMDDLKVRRKSMNEAKAEDYHFERWHPAFQDTRDAVTSPAFCEVMSKITGIDELFVTTDNTGSGLHQGSDGSYVDIHIDFNMSTKFNAWRRINLLIYLNKNWKEEYGGHLELWNKEMTQCEAKYAPGFNRAIIFLTDENSPHGYSKITIPEHESRKSFYVYYYTQVEEGVAYRDSRFLNRPDDSVVKKTMTSVKERLKITIKSALYKLGIKSLDFQDKN